MSLKPLPWDVDRPDYVKIWGLPVVRLSGMPLEPSIKDIAERIVRHGMADITLNGKPLVDPGPEPYARTHVIFSMVDYGTEFLGVSDQFFAELLKETVDSPHFAYDVIRTIHAGRRIRGDAFHRWDDGERAWLGESDRRRLEMAIAERHARERAEEFYGFRQRWIVGVGQGPVITSDDIDGSQITTANFGADIKPWQAEHLRAIYETHVTRPRDAFTITKETS